MADLRALRVAGVPSGDPGCGKRTRVGNGGQPTHRQSLCLGPKGDVFGAASVCMHRRAVRRAFAGAALYITRAEHPARMGLETRIAALQWAPSYKRATWMQVPLALLSFLSGVVAWRMSAGLGWLVAAVLIGAVVPFTLIGTMPTNHKLLAPGRDLGSAETRTLLER
jgi:hypothetical protein